MGGKVKNNYLIFFAFLFCTHVFCSENNKSENILYALRQRETHGLNKNFIPPSTLKFSDVFSRIIGDEPDVTTDAIQRLICYLEDHPGATAMFLRQIFGLYNAEKVAREFCSNGILHYEFTKNRAPVLSGMVKQYGFDVNYAIHGLFPSTTEGLSPLHLVSVVFERIADTQFLIDLGADPLYKAKVNYTPAEGLGSKSRNPYFSKRAELYGEILTILNNPIKRSLDHVLL
jgi:hypothetical protein